VSLEKFALVELGDSSEIQRMVFRIGHECAPLGFGLQRE
jgi:hypothetical protein